MTSRESLVAIAAARFDAVIFDLDGVITDTARVHFSAWKRLFDEQLVRAGMGDAPFTESDYLRHVDGRARIDGIEAFLTSRGIHLDHGEPDDPPDAQTAWGLANRKNGYYLGALGTEGVDVFESSVEVVRAVRAAGMRTAVVTASRNRAQVLDTAGLSSLFDAHVDGIDAENLSLEGKPDPATFLEATRRLDVTPARAVVFEDALAGVEAGHRGGFGLVVGVDRRHQAKALAAHGADAVVADLDQVQVIGAGGAR
jgi:beta-phosphoglucomutase family hydrolase